MSDKLNLGCGAFRKEGYVNVDASDLVGVDVRHDLDRFPYPFSDAQFSTVEADHIMEHLHDVFGAMREVHRILEDGGRLVMRVPHFTRGMTHPDHKRGFDVSFPYYFQPSFRGGYAGVHFELETVRLRWFAQPYLKRTVLNPLVYRTAALFGAVIDMAANVSPMACSRVWAFWVGGFEEIEFTLICRKGGSERRVALPTG
jgi:SAM-dependent methyltransferase